MEDAFGHIANPQSEEWIPRMPQLEPCKAFFPTETDSSLTAAWFMPASHLLDLENQLNGKDMS